MKNWKSYLQVTLSILLGAVLYLAIYIFISELLVRFYMRKYEITNRLDIGEDMGLGLLLCAVFILSLIVVMPITQYFSWRLMKSVIWFKR